jgi:regulator of replication initiation timing
LSKTRHKAVYIKEALDELFVAEEIDWLKVIAVNTDNPNVMIGLRREIIKAHPHIVGIRCCLHDLSTLTKHILLIKEAACPLIKKIKLQVSVTTSYFIESHYFSEVLDEWRKAFPGRMPPKLEPPGRTRFYTHGKTFNLMELYEAGFKLCSRLFTSRDESNKERNTPDISPAVMAALNDPDFFANAKVLSSFLKPIVDAIGKLECENSNLGDIWVQFILIYKAFKALIVPDRFRVFKEHCFSCLENITSKYRKVRSSHIEELTKSYSSTIRMEILFMIQSTSLDYSSIPDIEKWRCQRESF